MTTQHTGSGLLGRLSPRLYRQNAFRVTGLALTATGRDIRRKSDMLAVIEKTGGELPASDVLSPRPAPSAQDIRGALDRLGIPASGWSTSSSGSGRSVPAVRAAIRTRRSPL